MTKADNDNADQNEEQELRGLLVRVLREPLEEMTKQLQDKFESLLQEGVTKSRNNAIRAVEDVLRPTNENLTELTEAIDKLPRELKKESEAATALMISSIGEYFKNSQQQISTSIEGNYQVLLRETEANISRINGQLDDANKRSAAADSKIFIVCTLNLVAIVVLILFYCRHFF